MLIKDTHSGAAVTTTSGRALRRVVINASFGTLGLGTASLLLYPKIAALVAGGGLSLGTGFVANLALVFGSLMFLREAQRARLPKER
jgi:hypothetical protein